MTRHIRHPHNDHAGESLCGVRLYNHDWAFTSLDHAYNTLNNDGAPVPCPACIAQALQTLRAALSTPTAPHALTADARAALADLFGAIDSAHQSHLDSDLEEWELDLIRRRARALVAALAQAQAKRSEAL